MEYKIFISDSYDPFFNLAVETMLFDKCSAGERILYLWRNEDVVVIGRYQNPWRECNIDKMNEDGVHLMRRYTGGGAVFHDTNNICFSFISKKSTDVATGNDLAGVCGENADGVTNNADFFDVAKAENSRVICEALRSLRIDAEISGRNDITVDGFKISGAAYKESGDVFLHHGTILVGTDLTRLATYLQPDERKLKSKGISSVRARVANLRDLEKGGSITIEEVCDAVCRAFAGKNAAVRTHIEYIGKDALEKNPALQTEYEKLKSWEWRFGKSPEFTHRIDARFVWGGVDIQLYVKGAVVQSVEVFTDALDTHLAGEIKSALCGVTYNTKDLCDALEQRAESLRTETVLATQASDVLAYAALANAAQKSPLAKASATSGLCTMLQDIATYISGAFASK